jgi:hypothetical protein
MELGDLPDLIKEFCARHTDDPNLIMLPGDKGVGFSLGKGGDGPMFCLEVGLKSVTFTSGLDFPTTGRVQKKLRGLFEELEGRVAYGRLEATIDGAQWSWSAPALHYPYFNGIAAHAIAYAGYLGDEVWPVVQKLASGEITVSKAVSLLGNGADDFQHGQH